MRIYQYVALLVIILALTAACDNNADSPATQDDQTSADTTALTVHGDEIEQTYTLDQLRALPAAEVESSDGQFVGVHLGTLLQEAGFDLAQIGEVRVSAVDGFTSTYDEALFTREDAVLAYARAEADLNADEQPLRMVIPDEAGRMQPRQVTDIEVDAAS